MRNYRQGDHLFCLPFSARARLTYAIFTAGATLGLPKFRRIGQRMAEKFVLVGVVPETIVLPWLTPADAVMSVSSDADIDAAARSERAAISSSRQNGRNGIVVADHQSLRVVAALVAVVLAGR